MSILHNGDPFNMFVFLHPSKSRYETAKLKNHSQNVNFGIAIIKAGKILL